MAKQITRKLTHTQSFAFGAKTSCDEQKKSANLAINKPHGEIPHDRGIFKRAILQMNHKLFVARVSDKCFYSVRFAHGNISFGWYGFKSFLLLLLFQSFIRVSFDGKRSFLEYNLPKSKLIQSASAGIVPERGSTSVQLIGSWRARHTWA